MNPSMVIETIPSMIQDKPTLSSVKKTVDWMAWKVYQVNYTIVDAVARTITNLDGLDKVNKLMRAVFGILILYYQEAHSATIQALAAADSFLKIAANFLSSLIAVGRTKAVIAVDSKGNSVLSKESSLKKPSLVFLAIGKNLELISWLKSVNLFPSLGTGSLDIGYLSGISNQMGMNCIFEGVASIGLIRGKNFAVIISSGLSLFDNIEKIIDGKDFYYCCLGVANDSGKILICSIPMLFVSVIETYSFKFMAATIALIAISKILYKSYVDSPLDYPYWVK